MHFQIFSLLQVKKLLFRDTKFLLEILPFTLQTYKSNDHDFFPPKS